MTTPDRPFLAYQHEVRAIIAGRQTQFRRVVKFGDIDAESFAEINHAINPARQTSLIHYEGSGSWHFGTRGKMPDGSPSSRFALVRQVCCPFGQPGTRLWVRETVYELASFEFFDDTVPDDIPSFLYHADGEPTWGEWIKRPSIHMPRRASRLTLEVESVRVERVQEITEDDARAEGVEPGCLTCGENCLYRGGCGCCRPAYRDSFAYLWMNINGPNSWSANPWVWAVNFRVVGAG